MLHSLSRKKLSTSLPQDHKNLPLDSQTQDRYGRLERIVEGCDNDDVKAAFYRTIDNREKAAYYDTKIFRRNAGYRRNPIDALGEELRFALEHGSMESQQEKAQKLYDACLKAQDYEKALGVGRKFLQLSEETVNELHEQVLFRAMTMNGGLRLSDTIYLRGIPPINTKNFSQYIERVKLGKPRRKFHDEYEKEFQQIYGPEEWQEIPPERAQAVGRSSYSHLLMPDENFILWKEESYLQAGIIAKHFGWQKEMDAAGRKMAGQTGNICNIIVGVNCVYLALTELELSWETVQLLALSLFKVEIHDFKMAETLRKRYCLPDEKITPTVQEAYENMLKSGAFGGAAELRSFYERFIRDENTSLNDLRELAGVLRKRSLPPTAG